MNEYKVFLKSEAQLKQNNKEETLQTLVSYLNFLKDQYISGPDFVLIYNENSKFNEFRVIHKDFRDDLYFDIRFNKDDLEITFYGWKNGRYNIIKNNIDVDADMKYVSAIYEILSMIKDIKSRERYIINYYNDNIKYWVDKIRHLDEQIEEIDEELKSLDIEESEEMLKNMVGRGIVIKFNKAITVSGKVCDKVVIKDTKKGLFGKPFYSEKFYKLTGGEIIEIADLISQGEFQLNPD